MTKNERKLHRILDDYFQSVICKDDAISKIKSLFSPGEKMEYFTDITVADGKLVFNVTSEGERIYIDFGRDIRWLGLDYKQAMSLVDMITRKVGLNKVVLTRMNFK
jgi:hypothetical protein